MLLKLRTIFFPQFWNEIKINVLNISKIPCLLLHFKIRLEETELIIFILKQLEQIESESRQSLLTLSDFTVLELHSWPNYYICSGLIKVGDVLFLSNFNWCSKQLEFCSKGVTSTLGRVRVSQVFFPHRLGWNAFIFKHSL